MSALHPIPVGWASAGGTGAQNYDEFADDSEITALITANPDSMLAVEMPHRAPGAVAADRDFTMSLPLAVAALDGLRQRGRLVPFSDAIAVYQVGERFAGIFCLVDTAEIAAGPGMPGKVIRNEEVFAAKVAQRTALLRALETLTSPVLLIQTADGEGFYDVLAGAIERAGPPTVTDVDQHGLVHRVWLLGPGAERDRLLAAADAGELVVADGNHRSLAAQEAGLSRFLAVVVPARSVTLQPYQRLLRQIELPIDDVLAGLRASGAVVRPVDGRPSTPPRGTVILYAGGQTYEAELPAVDGSAAERLDHAVVERMLISDVLGLAPDDPAVSYIGGDYPAEWLTDQVDAGRAALAVLLAPVEVDDFVQVNLDRATMPRKSTWFTPKARTGLVLADVSADLIPNGVATVPAQAESPDTSAEPRRPSYSPADLAATLRRRAAEPASDPGDAGSEAAGSQAAPAAGTGSDSAVPDGRPAAEAQPEALSS